MENGNSSASVNRTDYSTDHTDDSLDYSMEYEGDDSTGESVAESESSSDIFSSGSESSSTENPVTDSPAADNNDAYISFGQVIHSLIGVDPTLPVPPHAARPPNVDDLINHLNNVIWQHQSALALAAPYMPVQPAIAGHRVIPVIANAGIMPGTGSFPAVPPARGNGGVVMLAGPATFPAVPFAGGMIPVTAHAGTGTFSTVPLPPAGGNGGVVMLASPGTFPAVPFAGGVIPVTAPAGTGTFSTVPLPPAGENGGTLPAVPESSSAVPPGNDATVPNPESLSAVPPAEGIGGKVQDKKGKSVLIEESNPSSSKPANILSSYKDPYNVPSIKPKPPVQSSSSIVAQAVAQRRVSLTLSLRDYLTSCNTTQLKQDERARKAECLRMFGQVVQIIHAAQAEGIILTDMRPSRFVFVTPGTHLRYTGALVLAESRSPANHTTTRKRRMEIDQQKGCGGLKSHKVCEDMEKELQKRHRDMKNAGYLSQFSITYWCQDDPTRSPEDPEFVQLEKKWYNCVEQRCGNDLGSYNVYSLGALLFELLCKFESPEKHFAAMEDLSKLILPQQLLAEEPEAAGFCLRLLNPATHPSTGEILDILAKYTFDEKGDEQSEEDLDSEVLLDFLLSLQERKEKHMARILEELMLIDTDISQLGKSYEPGSSSKDPIPCSLLNNKSQMETAYFSMKGRTGNLPADRPDIEILNNQVRATNPNVADNQKDLEEVAYFFEGVCKYAKYTKFEVCGTYWNRDLLNTPIGIYSMSFDPEERLIATTLASKKIKILEFASLLNDSLDLPYGSVEMNNDSMFSCVCWNPYVQSYLASADYDGVVKIWNASTGQEVNQYKEHKKRAWQVDTSHLNPTLFASASEEGTVKMWSMSQPGSTDTIQHRYSLYSAQYSRHSSNLMAIGSATGVVFCYDLRNTRAPWCMLASHEKPVTFVRFLDAETLVSSSTDSSLKIWDLKKSSQDGPSPNACTLTITGHRNSRNFLGLADYDGYIACGSETNEVFAYHRSFPMPITTHAFGAAEPLSEHLRDDVSGLFVSSVCWGQKSGMIAASNSVGSIKVLRLV